MSEMLAGHNIVHCLSCGERIIFARKWGTAPGSSLNPIEANPVRGGNLILTAEGTYLVLDIMERRRFDDPETPFYISHFARCPARKEWRRA